MWRPSIVVPTAVVMVALAAACGGKEPEPAKAPSLSDPSGAASGPPPAPAASASAEPEATTPRKQRPLEIYSHCAEVVTVVFAEDPKSPAAGKRTIAPSSAIDGPREKDGNQTVWLLDNSGEPLVKVHVTRGMKRVEIGRSCRTLDAR